MNLVVYCTCPNNDVAVQIAEALVEQRLAACVNLLPRVQSIYRWQGQIENDTEFLLMIKSDADHFDALRRLVIDLHPYELPEIIGVPIEHGHPEYLKWISETLSDT